MRIDFFKEGKGVSPNEPEKSRFVKFFLIYAMRFWKLISLNLLYLLLCLPIVTIGPATVAAVYVLRKFGEEKLAYVWSDFWRVFRSSFWKSFVVSLLAALAAGAAGASAYFYLMQAFQEPLFFALFAVALLVLLLVSLAWQYAVVLVGVVELPLGKIVKNSLLLSLGVPGANLLVLLVWTFGVACSVLLFPAFLLIVLLFWPATLWYVTAYVLGPLVQKHCAQ